MTDARKVRAVHPHWTGTLRLFPITSSLVLEEYGSTGTYRRQDGLIVVEWDRFDPDLFCDAHGVWVHKTILDEAPRLHDVCMFSVDGGRFRASQIILQLPDSGYELSLRTGTTDIPTFEQVFGRKEYASPNLPSDARAIVDLGANIGLSAVYFALRFPSARILALEPSEGNYLQLVKNIAAIGDRVQAIHAAGWSADGAIRLQTESTTGDDLGEWGYQVSAQGRGAEVACFGPEAIISMSGADRIDILKVDIEGAELEFFGANDRRWLDAVDLIIVETHERFRPGSDAVVREALSAGFVELPSRGENLFFKNKTGSGSI